MSYGLNPRDLVYWLGSAYSKRTWGLCIEQSARFRAGACRNQQTVTDWISSVIVPAGKQPESGPFARAISAEVRAVMARHRVSATLLADRAGMSRGYLGRRLRDEVSLTFNDLESICEAMREELPVLLRAAFKRMDTEATSFHNHW